MNPVPIAVGTNTAYSTESFDGSGTRTIYDSSPASVNNTAKYFKLQNSTPTPDPDPTPTPTPEPQKDNDNQNTQSSNTKKSENTYVNPLQWNYTVNQQGSLCIINQQGPLCKAAFKTATPTGYTEAFSFNLSLQDNKGGYKSTYEKKTGKYVLYIPKEYRKTGRTFMLIGIDKMGKTRLFTDEDFSGETLTTTLDIEGYAFSLIYTDTAATKQ